MIFFRRNIILSLILCILFVAQTATAKELTVALEPMPPLIIDKDNGYTVDLLKKIAQTSDLTFQITTMPYVRAKKLLKDKKVDLIAHVPYGLETDDFYKYATELNWSIKTPADLYAMDKNKLNDIKNLKIGIPRGNEDFASEIFGVSQNNFHVGKIDNLLNMLQARRIDAFWFERSSTMTTLKKFKIDKVYYVQVPEQPVLSGFAVQKNENGARLKKLLDDLIIKVNPESIFIEYLKYANMPDQGMFKLTDQ